MRTLSLLLLAIVAIPANAKTARKISSATEITEEGKIEEGIFGKGSKSESKALFIVSEEGEKLKLRAPGQNPFMIDKHLAELKGKEVKCRGLLDGGELLDAVCTPLD